MMGRKHLRVTPTSLLSAASNFAKYAPLILWLFHVTQLHTQYLEPDTSAPPLYLKTILQQFRIVETI